MAPLDDRGGLSILRARSGHYATKRYSRSRTGGITKSAYGNEKWFSATTVEVGGIADLAALLDHIQRDPLAFIVRGALLPEATPQLTRRLLHPDPRDGHPATFRSACRQWIPLDFDGIAAPAITDPAADPEDAIEYGVLSPNPRIFGDLLFSIV
jgi:hypothetical protein